MPNMFGFKTQAELMWEAEFDARVKDPNVEKDVMANWGPVRLFRPREIRVKDDAGTFRRRNGNGCCGCGRWHVTGDDFGSAPVVHHHYADTEGNTDHHHHHEDDDDQPHGYFCSWL